MFVAKVCAVIVTYRPDWGKVTSLVRTITQESADYIIIDNSDDSDPVPPSLKVTRLGGNMGIAHAQNVGISHCLKQRAEVIVFFDQDSIMPELFLGKLVQPIIEGTSKITAPVFHDQSAQFDYAIVAITRWGFRRKLRPGAQGGALTTNVVISSGSAVAAEVFGLAGTMDESLFIDFVDTEWCLRCFAKGLTVLIVPQVSMAHSIGSKTINFGIFRVPLHPPQRRYYRVRNSLLLLRLGHVPKLMALREIFFSLVQQLILIAMCKDRLSYFRYLVLGLRDGLINKRGKLDS